MEQQNDTWLRITGKVNIPEPLEVDKDYFIAGQVGVYGLDTASKQDGTFNQTYKAQFVDTVDIIAEKERVIHGKKKGSHAETFHRRVVGRGADYDCFMEALEKPEVFDAVFSLVEKSM